MRKTLPPLIAIALVLLCQTVCGQSAAVSPDIREFERWRTRDPKAKSYIGIEHDCRELIMLAETNRLPAELLLEKLKEGAAKAVPAQKLLDTLRGEYSRIAEADAVLTVSGVTETAGRTERIRELSIFILSGFPPDLIRHLFETAIRRTVDVSGTRPTPVSAADAAISVLHALLRISTASGFHGSELSGLGDAMLGSRMPPAGYGTLASMFVKAVNGGISGSEILALIEGTLGNGGGIVQMEAEIQRRMKRR